MQDAQDVMDTPLITVVMPVFNRERFLAEAIESVLAQSYPHWELIVVDDGSADNSHAIAQRYAARFPERIRVVTHENGANRGISASRNLGGRNARGSYIAGLDSDDMWVPHKLEAQVNILRRFPEVGLIVGATDYWYPEKERAHRHKPLLAGGPRDRLVQPPELFSVMYPIGQATAPSMNTILLRKTVFDRLGGWVEQFRTSYEDQAFLCKIYLTEAVYISSEIWDIYRQHQESIMATELHGIRYFRQRFLFLKWLEHWFATERPDRTEEHRLVREALYDRKLWPFRGPVRYTLWRSVQKMRRVAGKTKRAVRGRR